MSPSKSNLKFKSIPDTNSNILEKIKWAEDIFRNQYFKGNLLDNEIKSLVSELDLAVNECLKVMKEKGVTSLCSGCGESSCCGEGIEDKFDAVTLLINLLLGVKLPERREIEGGCFFLKRDGCSLRVREVICLNYFCEEIYKRLEFQNLIAVQKTCGKEMDILFTLSERIKKKIFNLGWMKNESR
jgi:hypothetical protein